MKEVADNLRDLIVKFCFDYESNFESGDTKTCVLQPTPYVSMFTIAKETNKVLILNATYTLGMACNLINLKNI